MFRATSAASGRTWSIQHAALVLGRTFFFYFFFFFFLLPVQAMPMLAVTRPQEVEAPAARR